MLRPIDNWYNQQPDPAKSCLQFLRTHILSRHPAISEAWKYGMPFFCFNGKMCCYLWIDKKEHQPYIGIVEGNKIYHPELISGKRSRMKILMLDANNDLPLKKINSILAHIISLYK